MKIDEIVAKITTERHLSGRFPTRLIFIPSFNDYLLLVDKLRGVCDDTFDLADYTEGDILPNFKALMSEVVKHHNKQLLFLSFGEYLRICIKRERDKSRASFPDIWGQIQPTSSQTKYIIPIFGDRDIFDTIIPNIDIRQMDYIWEVDDTPITSELYLTIFSPAFEDTVSFDAQNLQDWLRIWVHLYNDTKKNSFSLKTKLLHYAENTYGVVRQSIINNPFSYAVSLFTDGDKLPENAGDDNFWGFVAQGVQKGIPFSDTIKSKLNIGHTFDPIAILDRFTSLTDNEKMLFLMWYKLYPTDDYFTIAINKATTIADIGNCLRDTIFEIPNPSDDFYKQRADALRAIETTYTEDFFNKLDKLSFPELRLKILTYKTHAECAYAIKTVSEMLLGGADITEVAELVRIGYPLLAEYLQPSNAEQGEIARYFNWYRRSKIENKPNTDVPCDIDIISFDSRNKFISENNATDSHQFWVDGLGAEWIPVLLYLLKSLSKDINIDAKIAQAIIPSVTDYNKKGVTGEIKWDRLDDISHKGIPDDKNYFSTIAGQLKIMIDIVERIKELLDQYNTVIVTGDHGSSRLAALLFHDEGNFAIEPPKNATVCSFGRYVEFADDKGYIISSYMERKTINNAHFIVMKDYHHFKQSGNALDGEIHGGGTPEECLVPVIFVSRKTPLTSPQEPKKPTGIIINDGF